MKRIALLEPMAASRGGASYRAALAGLAAQPVRVVVTIGDRRIVRSGRTTLEFRPALQRQRDDAADKGQVGRQKIFDGLLSRLDAQAS